MFESEEKYLPKKIELKGKVVNCNLLNVRSEPDISSSVTVVIQKGEEVVIDGNKTSDKWLSVSTKDGIKGYCMKAYIDIEE